MNEQNLIGKSRQAALDRMDAMPSELRECVYEFGLPIVSACLTAGIQSPKMIRTLVREIWAGARQHPQRSDTRGMLDWLFIQEGSGFSAKKLNRLLYENHMFIASSEPTRAMLDASVATVSGFDLRVTKEEKHRLRLRAALRAEMESILNGKKKMVRRRDCGLTDDGRSLLAG